MANISAIKLPNNETYNLKDSISGYTTNTGTITKVQTTAGAHTTINVSSGAASFNVPTKTSHLTNDSGFLTNSTLYESQLNWGNTGLSGNVTPMGASLSTEHSANRIAFLNPAAIQIEYTTNGGSSWADSGYTNDDKMWLCTGSTGIAVGQSKSGYSQSTALTTNHWTRITLTGQNGTTGYVYTAPKKLLINMGTAVGVSCVVEYKTGVSNASWQTFGTYAVSGWSGWNDIPLVLGTFGGGTTQTSNNWYLRFTFKVTSTRTDSYKGYSQVLGLRLFGATDWTSASSSNSKGPISSTGHLYSFDVGANATFPAKVTASGGFSGNLTGNVTGNVSGSAGSVAWSGVGSKPTTLSGYGITDAKIANGVITLGSNTITPLTSHNSYSITNSGSGNAVTAVSLSGTTFTVTKGTTFLTSHQDISGKADKSATVSTITWDSTNNKLTKTINGSTTDVVTLATIKTALGSMPASDVYSWAKASTKPSYTASEVGALASNTTYVSTVSTSAGAHSTISSKSGAVSFNVPTKTSHLTNDSGFLTSITHQTIKQDGITGATVNRFGTCGTTAGTAAKTVSITTGTFSLEAGAEVTVKFTYANTAGTPTLNVNSTGAKNIFHRGAQITTGANKALLTGTVKFIYDGTQYHLVGDTWWAGGTTSITPVTAKTVVTGVTKKTVVTGGSTTNITPVTAKTVVTGVTKKTVVTGGSTTNITPVTSKTVVTSASGATASYSSGVLTLTNGSFSTGASVTAGTAVAAYTSLTTGDSVTVTTGDSVTAGTTVAAYTSLTTGDSVTVTTGDSVTTGTAVNAITSLSAS